MKTLRNENTVSTYFPLAGGARSHRKGQTSLRDSRCCKTRQKWTVDQRCGDEAKKTTFQKALMRDVVQEEIVDQQEQWVAHGHLKAKSPLLTTKSLHEELTIQH